MAKAQKSMAAQNTLWEMTADLIWRQQIILMPS